MSGLVDDSRTALGNHPAERRRGLRVNGPVEDTRTSALGTPSPGEVPA